MEQSHDIFQPPLQQRVCLASGLPGCTAQLYKYCTSKGLVKTPTSSEWRASSSTIRTMCTNEQGVKRVFVFQLFLPWFRLTV